MKSITITKREGIYLNVSSIPKDIYRSLREEFTYKNPSYMMKRQMKLDVRNEPRHLMSYSLSQDKKWMIISRGAEKRLIEKLKVEFNEINVRDQRTKFEPGELFKIQSNFSPRNYQEEAANRAVQEEQCLIQGECGSGKTEICIYIMCKVQQPTLVVVHTESLMNQWIKRISSRLGIEEKLIGKIGGKGKNRDGDGRITIAIVASLKSRIDLFKGKKGLLIVDEVHRSPTSAFSEIIQFSDAFYRIGVSATMKRKDGKHFLMKDQFGEIAYKIDNKKLEKEGVRQESEIYVIKTDFYWDKYTTININEHDEEVSETKYHLYGELLTRLSEDKKRNNIILKILLREKIFENKNYFLILTQRRRHCDIISNSLKKINIDCNILRGGEKTNEESISLANEGKINCLIGTTVADEALDIPRLNVGIITSPSAANDRQINQQIGRFKRKFEGKEYSRIYYLWDYKMPAFEKHFTKLKKYGKIIVLDERELLNG